MVQLVRPVTIPRATLGTSPAIWARGWGVALKRSSRGLSWVGGRANRRYLPFVFVKYIIYRTVDNVTVDFVAVERFL